jgi:hypothetical protein
MATWKPPPFWKGGECFILGGGPSVARVFGVPDEVSQKFRSGALEPAVLSPYLEPIHGRHVVGINNAYMLGPWIDIIFFGDCGWYIDHRLSLAKLTNLKVSCCPRFGGKAGRREGVKYLKKDPQHRTGITERQGFVSWNSNSGYASVSMASHLGVRRIVLLGFDMRRSGDATHWHRTHDPSRKNDPYNIHMKGTERMAEDAARLGIEILNCSPDSAIKAFPKVGLKDVL